MELEQLSFDDSNSVKFKEFLTSLVSSNWAVTANEKTIDNIFKRALEFEDIFNNTEASRLKEEISKSYPSLNLDKFLLIVLENIIKCEALNEYLTLYAINKYKLLHSKEDFYNFLENIVLEVELRGHLYKLIESLSDVDLDLFKLNKFLCDISNSPDLKSKVEYALKNQTSTFLNAVKHGEALTANNLINEIIDCLEAQTDLRLWFMILKEHNLEVVLYLCSVYKQFFNAVLKFFDKFAGETESNYDEDLSVQYSHVNLDFEDFLKILQLFLNQTSLKKSVKEFLNSKNLSDKNFCFWVDVKSCL